MARFEVYLFNLPRVSDDGDELLSPGESKTRSFDDAAAAGQFASDNREKFERVVVLDVSGESKKLVERYRDGRHEPADAITRR